MGAILAALLLGATPASPDVAVVCPPAMVEAMGPWLAHRASQGHRVALIAHVRTADGIAREIRELAQSGSLRYVVIVGDDEPAAWKDRLVRARTVPAFRVPAKVNIKWGSETEIATDNPYADLDGDQTPDLAIGRLTADSPEELSRIVAKIIAYERAADFGPWRARVNFVAGVGGFGRVTDAIVEMTTKRVIAGGLPAEYESTMTHAQWQSPYCPAPSAFAPSTVARLNEGCLFWVYLGHGRSRALDVLEAAGRRFRIFDVRDVPHLRCSNGAPIAVMMACHTGAFDKQDDCLAEEMLARPGGPVAVICGSRVTMPYGMAVLGHGMMQAYFSGEAKTLGDVVLLAKRESILPQHSSTARAAIDVLASAVNPSGNTLAEERIEHLHLFNLLGDPLLRLARPQTSQIDAPSKCMVDQPLAFKVKSPLAGRCYVELVARRDRLTFSPPPRDPSLSTAAQAQWQDVYRRANNRRYATARIPVEKGEYQIELDVPKDAVGACHVRVFIEGDDGFAMGAANVEIRRREAK